ncbi:hypothetical protein DOY81_004652 [Sarcophaga bullata]|nr:hypothetical protein DOY81_004652 [Sarcophaga bullata]
MFEFSSQRNFNYETIINNKNKIIKIKTKTKKNNTRKVKRFN